MDFLPAPGGNSPSDATRGPPVPSELARARVRALEDDYLHERFRRQPEDATRLGWPSSEHVAVADVRPEALAVWHRFEDGILAHERAIDTGAVAGNFSADVYRLGQLFAEAVRAARLVVDTGLNVFGWPR